MPESAQAIEIARWVESVGWKPTPLHTVGPDGQTCSCSKGRNCGKSAGKHNIGQGWQKDLRGVEIFEEMAAKRPKLNVGILTGAPSGIVVLDIDVNSGGFESMKAIIAEHGALPPTFIVQTGTGGFHYYFQTPDFDVRNSAGKVAQGIDIRGTGGMVVAPGSVSWAGPYVTKQALAPAPLPQWLHDLLLERFRASQPAPVIVDPAMPPGGPAVIGDFSNLNPFEGAPPEPTLPTQAARTEATSAYEQSIIDGELKRVRRLSEAGWNAPWDVTTFEVACQLIELANAPWSALTLDAAHALFMQSCPPIEPGYNPTAKWSSALQRIGSKAREAPTQRSDIFDDNPDVTTARPPDPTVGGGTDREGVPTTGSNEAIYFGNGGLQTAQLAFDIMGLGPIRLGQNKRWWTWDDGGVWRENPDAVKHRTIHLIPNRYRSSHAMNAADVVGAHAERIFLDNPDSDYINFRNGMLHWRSGEVKDHDPSFLSTVQLPVSYNADAVCPKFDAFLDSVMSPAYVKLAWEMIGYLMFSGNPLQKAFLLHGTGGNGKGTLIRVIQSLLGNENTSSVSLDRLNGSHFAPSALFGKIANLAGDIDGTFQESTATFKMLTGEDRISGEYKYGDAFTFACWAVPVFSANKIPGSADVSVGYLRRWVVLEFNRSFVGEPILNLSDQLETELEGIAAKALTFLGPLLDRAHFDVAGEASQGADDFAMALDQVRQWADEWTHPAPGNQIQRDLLYARYTTWANANGAGKLRASEFYSRLEAAGYPHKKIKGRRVFCDVFLLDADRSMAPATSTDDFFQ